MDDWLGKGAARVIPPITDPCVVHHGAVGSFATACLPEGANKADIMAKLDAIGDMILVVDMEGAIRRFELPADRIGDIAMISGENMTIGTSADRHDLVALIEPLRSHGGLTEHRKCPFSSTASSTWAIRPICVTLPPFSMPPQRRCSNNGRDHEHN